MNQDMQCEWAELNNTTEEDILSSLNFLSFREVKKYKRKVYRCARLQAWRGLINVERAKEGLEFLYETWDFHQNVRALTEDTDSRLIRDKKS